VFKQFKKVFGIRFCLKKSTIISSIKKKIQTKPQKLICSNKLAKKSTQIQGQRKFFSNVYFSSYGFVCRWRAEGGCGGGWGCVELEMACERFPLLACHITLWLIFYFCIVDG